MKNGCLNIKYIALVVMLMYLFIPSAKAQKILKLNLQRTIEMANDSSLSAFRHTNLYLKSYWEFRTYKANRLPSLSLDLTPAQYYRSITQRYDSGDDIDVYREQQMYIAAGGFNLKQNLDITGGTFYVNSNLDYMRNFGDTKSTQYSTIPIRIGYEQNILGYNAFKWEKKIEPLKYERAKKELVYNMESVAEEAVTYFFNLAMAQAEYNLSKENKASADTLYNIGVQRYRIASISQADLLTLELDKVNAENSLKNKYITLKRAMFLLASFLNIDNSSIIEVELPNKPTDKYIPLDEALAIAKESNPVYLEQRQNILEAEHEVDKTKKESRFNAGINASIGFNQVASNIGHAYRDIMPQDMVSLSISIPILDWGVRKGKNNMAKNNLDVVRIAAKQEELGVEEEVIITVNDFNMQHDLIMSAENALEIATTAYEQTRKRFVIGKADVNSLILSQNRQQEAQKNYISTLQNYWMNYYKIRKLTLYDFENRISLSDKFDYNMGL